MARPKKRGKRALPAYADGGAVEGQDPELISIPLDFEEPDNGEGITIDPDSGAVVIEHEDGSITIDPDGDSLWQEPDGDSSHDENLALKIDSSELGRISEELITGIEADKQDRTQWESMRAKCIELLGIKLEDPKGDVSRSALGMSTSVVRDPTMLQAVNMFRANTYGELCPSSGPVKVKIATGIEAKTSQENADNLQADLNYYLMNTASEYYPDMFYMLWWTGLVSGTFKKVYHDPLKNRPVSQYIEGTKLIVADATDLKNSERITHEVEMPRSIMRAMQLKGVYRDIELHDPMPAKESPVAQKKAAVAGMGSKPQRIEDQNYTLYESYCKLDIKGYEHKIKGKPTGLPLPYRVTIDEGSREVLEIRRNWDEDDEEDNLYLEPRIPIIAFPFSTGLLRTYGTGLGHEMGNMASALTALLRISIDNGILGNYPGTIKAKGPSRDVVNEIMVPPGGTVEVDTGGLPISQFIMPLPYKDVSGSVMQLIEQTRGAAKELGGTANMPLTGGESSAAIPVGTMLAQIEQALKPLAATHKMLCTAQAEEFRQLVRLFRDDPEALWRGNKRPKCGTNTAARLAIWKQALEDCDIEPVADPNVPSEMHRKLMAMALKQLTMGNPAYDQVKVDRYIARMVFKMDSKDFDEFLAPQQDNGPDPIMMDLQIKAQDVQAKTAKYASDAQLKKQQLDQNAQIEAAKLGLTHAANQQETPAGPTGPTPDEMALRQREVDIKAATAKAADAQKTADREAKLTVAAMDLAAKLAEHPEGEATADQELGDLEQAGYAHPAKGTGGPVKTPEQGASDHHAGSLADMITKALMERRAAGTTH